MTSIEEKDGGKLQDRVSAPRRQPWVQPRIQRMAAGDAENTFSRTRSDGQYTFS